MKLFGWIALLGAASSAAAYEKYTNFTVYRLHPHNARQLEYLQVLEDSGIDFWRSPDKINRVADMMLPPGDERSIILGAIEALKIQHEVMIADVEANVQSERMEQQTVRHEPYGRSTRTEAVSGFWNTFQRYGSFQNFVTALAAQNPKIVEASTIGKSYEKRDIAVVRIGADSNNAKPVIFVEGGIHAREWASPATVSYFAQELVNRYNNGDDVVVALLNKYDFYIVPVLNVDGYEYTHTNSRLWRKTRRPSDNNKSCVGADPNRNWGFQWGGTGASTNPCAETYRGDGPFSEFETRAESDFIEKVIGASRVKSYIAVHSYGQYWLYPWGYTSALTPDDAQLKAKAIVATTELKKKYGTKFTYGTSTNVLYAAAGGSDDWTYSKGITYSYTVELRDTGLYGFQLPASLIKPTAEETSDAFIAMFNSISNTRAGGNQRPNRPHFWPHWN